MRVLGEEFGDGAAQNAHAVAMHDPHAIDGGERGAVEELVHLVARFLGVLAYHVDLAPADVPRRAGGLVGDAFGQTAPAARIGTGENLLDVLIGDLHFHEARFHLVAVAIEPAADARGFAHTAQPYARTLLDGGALGPRGGGSGEYVLLHLFPELAARFRHAAARLLRGFPLLARFADLIDGLLRARLEFGDGGLDAAIHFPQLRRLSLFPFTRQRFFAGRERFPLFLDFGLFARHGIEPIVQFGDEPRDIAFLVGHDPAGPFNERCRQAEARRDVQSRRLARRAGAQNVRWLQRLVIEAHGRVQHTLGAGAVDLQREQVRGGEGKGAP